MILPAQDYQRTHIVYPEKPYEDLDNVMHGLVGRYSRRRSIGRNLKKEALKIYENSLSLRHTSDRKLRERLNEIQVQFRRQAKGYEEFLPEVLAFLVEAAERTLGLRPYPVQVMGAMALYKGYLAEMATGEGKSLTACLAAVLAAWSGRPCHFVTVNDYLASRDAMEMRKFYAFCGVSVGCVTGQMVPKERRENYERGMVYTTLKELVADFLRDRLILGGFHNYSRRVLRQMLQPHLRNLDGLVLRGLDTAIVDEADSVLIDEAVTPLIISRTQENTPLVEACRIAYTIACSLKSGEDYLINVKYKEIELNEAGLDKVELQTQLLPGIWQGAARREELIKQALTAREFYNLDKQYVIQDDKITIVDEFTGRLMPNRTWRHGLHQSVEAKEGLEVSDPSETMARLSFQRFFRFFRRLSGMTGTAQEATPEFWQIYNLPVMTIPTNRPCIRKILPDSVFPRMEEKWEAIVVEIVKWRGCGRPVLVGTKNVMVSEILAKMLAARGLEFNLLNAVRHREEAQIIAAAGEQNKITIATNMAGRGTDIKLGRGVAKMGGLHVIATERFESGRIDRQLFGRCARQGDAGSAQVFISMEDELISRFIPAHVRNFFISALRMKMPGARLSAKTVFSNAQRVAQLLAFRQRRNVLQVDTWLEEALSFSGPGSEF